MEATTLRIDVQLYDGDPCGVVSLGVSRWGHLRVFIAPRESVNKLLRIDQCHNNGVYLLLSDNMILVGQTDELERHLPHHMAKDAWWETAAVVTTDDNSLGTRDAMQMEEALAQRASALGKLNHTSRETIAAGFDHAGNERVDSYVEQALFLLAFKGIRSFLEDLGASSSASGSPVRPIGRASSSIRPPEGERLRKSVAVKYVRDRGVDIGKNVTYASLQKDSPRFWANPRTSMLSVGWDIVLNDTQQYELVVLHVPSRTLAIRGNGRDGLLCRSDKPDRLDLSIDRDSMTDARSGVHFARFVVTRVAY